MNPKIQRSFSPITFTTLINDLIALRLLIGIVHDFNLTFTFDDDLVERALSCFLCSITHSEGNKCTLLFVDQMNPLDLTKLVEMSPAKGEGIEGRRGGGGD